MSAQYRHMAHALPEMETENSKWEIMTLSSVLWNKYSGKAILWGGDGGVRFQKVLHRDVCYILKNTIRFEVYGVT